MMMLLSKDEVRQTGCFNKTPAKGYFNVKKRSGTRVIILILINLASEPVKSGDRA